MKRFYATIGCGLIAIMEIVADGQATAPAPRIVLVELFTSEGCSSCPPADALLRRLTALKTTSGQKVVGISEHVTYWNQGGWADPFSAETYTDRQSDYARRFGLDNVYTPQMVVNGQQQTVGGNTQEILRAVNLDANQDQGPNPPRLNIEAALVQDKKIAVTFTLHGALPDRAEVWAVVADDMAASSVLRGENSGRTLQHVSVARAMTRLGRAQNDQPVTVSLPNPSTIKGQAPTSRHLILFVQAAGLGKVLTVAALPLT